MKILDDFQAFPLTLELWQDFEGLFGPRGACAGCWCMYWRLARSVYKSGAGEGNREKLLSMVRAGSFTGLLGYLDGETAGWISFGPRSDFSTLDRSRLLKPLDGRPVWSIVCFFIARRFRNQGVSLLLLNAATQYAKEHGIGILEGYPVIPKHKKGADVFMYTGIASAFQKAGFEIAARPSESRAIMRYYTTLIKDIR
jgi:GNAT superfamily N-acetyltransferase